MSERRPGGSGGGGRSFSGAHAGGSNSGGGRRGGNIHVGGRAGGFYNSGGRTDGRSVGGRGNRKDYEPHLTNDDLYAASSEDSSEDSEEDAHFNDADAGGNDDDEASGHNGEDGGGHDIDGSGTDTDDGDDMVYSRRGYSLGAYANVPQAPHPIRMAKKVIDNPTATRTLLALMRIYWPVGCIGTMDIDRCCPRWWRFIRKNFFRYYTYDSRYGTEQDARRAVSFYLHENIRKTQARERERAQKLIKKKGGSFINHRPPYLSEPVWEAFCKYWDTPEFKKKSDAAKKNRKKQRSKHHSGATSFRRRAWDVLEATGEEPGEYHLFLKMHTDKDGNCSSEFVGVMMERYIELCQEQNVDPNRAPIHTWAKAVGVRKNSIIGVPRTKASDIIPIERSRKRRRGREDEESGASTNGRPLVHHMADDFVIQTVDRTVAYARSHPEEFCLAPEQVSMLAQSVSVAEGEGELPPNHPLSMRTMTELVQVMVSVLIDIQARKDDTNNGKGKSAMRADYCPSSDNDDFRQSPLSPLPDRRQNGIHIRG